VKRLLYLYPEEWTGRRARELHTLQTCLAMARNGVDVTLLTAGGLDLNAAVEALDGAKPPAHLHADAVSRRLGPVKSAGLFQRRFRHWLERHPAFDTTFVIHLKAAKMLREANLPYWWEAHEIFSETPDKGSRQEARLADEEGITLKHATGRIATSQALADALRDRYVTGRSQWPFEVIPHGGPEPLAEPSSDPAGPVVYAGSLAGWKGLPVALQAVAEVGLPLRVIAGDEAEWSAWSAQQLKPETVRHIEWCPRVPAHQLREHLAGCRLGLCPTVVASGSGRYSLPMKLFDYASAGLPALASALPSLQGLGSEGWCRQVAEPSGTAWKQAMGENTDNATQARSALDWAARHTWSERGRRLVAALFPA